MKAIDYESFTLFFYKPMEPINVLISMDSNCRIHRQSVKPKYMGKSHNLVEFLKAYIIGGRVINIIQIDNNRIIKMEINKGDKIYFLIIRLWGGFPNIIITDTDYTILHLHRKSSKKSELPGMKFIFPEPKKNNKAYLLKEHTYHDYNSFIEAEYIKSIENNREEKQLKKAMLFREKREKEIDKQLMKLGERLRNYSKADDYKLFGDLILSNIHNITKGNTNLNCENYITGKDIIIPLNPELRADQNSANYYKKHQKALAGLSVTENLIKELEFERKTLKTELPDIPKEQNNRLKPKNAKPGLNYNSGDWEITVGRSAKENEELLRRWMKGNDMWLHVRDYPGSYVFIKSKKNKTIPLNILMAAGQLALFYSKGKINGKGDITYTQVKHLRKIKKGKPGQVIPTMNKNLYIKLDKSPF